MKRFFYVFFASIILSSLIFISNSFCQESTSEKLIDSIRNELKKSQNKSNNLYQELFEQFILLRNIDSSLYYLKKAYNYPEFNKDLHYKHKYYYNYGRIHVHITKNNDSIIYYFKKSIEIFNQLSDQKEIDQKIKFNQYRYLSEAYENKSLQTEALNYGKKAYEVALELNDSLLLLQTLLNIGYLETDLGLQVQGIESFHEGLRIAQKQNNEQFKARFHMAIGYNYFFSNEFDKANENYKKALVLAKKLETPMGISISYINIAGVFQAKSQYDSALNYFKKALQIQENTINDPSTVSNILNNLGTVSIKLGKFNKGESYLLKSMEIYKELNYEIGLSMVFVDIGSLYTELKEYRKAIGYFNKSEKIAKKYKLTHVLRKVFKSKAEYYAEINQYKNAYIFKNKFHSLNDSVVSLDSKKQIANIEAVYELEQTNTKLKVLNIENNYQKQIIKRQNQFQYLSIGIIATTLIIIILAIRLLRIKSRANKKILEQKNQILEQNEELRQQTEEISTQRDQIEEQKDKIESTHNELMQSIHYAKFIQGAALPTAKLLSEIIPEHFIFMQPQNVVGGDFYWVSRIDKISVIAVADCTGHGVPGGFLSMLAMSLLNEIVNKEKNTEPASILNKLRESFIRSLHQNKEKGSIKDGMDITICAINYDDNTVAFAGANNPALICQAINNKPIDINEVVASDNLRLYEINVNKMSISIGYKMIDFSQQTYSLDEIDYIYMFTDGFADQFGGKNNKKYLRSNFKRLILESATLTLDAQRRKISETFNNWKNRNEQYDDVLVLGFKPQK
jgi:serine phosphatase RsbU (regulator of sigma subunit)/Tfp pilus assembly protein PilF